MKIVQYLGVAMATVYVLAGIWLLFAPLILGIEIGFPNANILGGLLIGYGFFRIYRFYTQYKNETD